MPRNENRAETLRAVYESAEAFLYEIAPYELSSDEMGRYFVVEMKKTISEILYVLLGSLQNRSMHTKVIGLWSDERAPIFKEIFFGYDADAILQAYTDDSLFECFQKHFTVNNAESKDNIWRAYAKAVISGCEFMKKFDSAEAFDDFVLLFTNTQDLPKLLEKDIYGMGFALACDFLKDLGYTEYAKPDVHLKDIFSALNLCENDDLAVFNTIVEMADIVGKTPFVVDRVFWIIGSGNFYLHKPVGRKKDKFIEKMKTHL